MSPKDRGDSDSPSDGDSQSKLPVVADDKRPSGPGDLQAHLDGPRSARRISTLDAASIEQVREEWRVSHGVMTDPRSIHEYETACPGTGKRILDEFFESTDKQRQHREEMERKGMEGAIAYDNRLLQQGDRGQWMAFVLAVACIAASVWLASGGHDILAGTFATTTILALVSAFIYGRKKLAEETIAEANGPPKLAAPTPQPTSLPAATKTPRPAKTKSLPPRDERPAKR